MKKKNFKALALQKRAIATMTSNEVKGGITISITTIGEITNSCPHKCGSMK